MCAVTFLQQNLALAIWQNLLNLPNSPFLPPNFCPTQYFVHQFSHEHARVHSGDTAERTIANSWSHDQLACLSDIKD